MREMRAAAPKASKIKLDKGDTAAAMTAASKKVQASYEWPFQSHASMGPGCAVADFQADGVTTIWSGAQKPHALKQGVAELLRVPVDKVRVIWMEIPDRTVAADLKIPLRTQRCFRKL